jgi:TolA-binding protein
VKRSNWGGFEGMDMGLGSTAKKIQALSEHAETMYTQVQELQQRIMRLEGEVDDTHDTVNRMDHQLTEQRELLVAIANEHDLDGEQILAEAAIEPAEAEEAADAAAETADTEETQAGDTTAQ